MALIDTHAHLYLDEFKEDIRDCVSRSLDSGVEKILMPNIDSTTIDSMLELETSFPEVCFPMMGLHPCSVDKDFEKELYLVENWLNKRDFNAIGETGIDLYWDKMHFVQQCEALKIQIEWAKKFKIPIVLHTRDSFEETFKIVENLKDDDLTGVFHCFTGSVQEAEKITKIGFSMGIGGVSTFKNGGMEQVIPTLPLENLLLETDSPYLAPAPHRGKRNEPAFIPIIAQRISDITGIELEKIHDICYRNAVNLFQLTG